MDPTTPLRQDPLNGEATFPLHQDPLNGDTSETPHQEPQRTCTRSSPCHYQECLACHTPTNHVRDRDPNYVIRSLTIQFRQAIKWNDPFAIDYAMDYTRTA